MDEQLRLKIYGVGEHREKQQRKRRIQRPTKAAWLTHQSPTTVQTAPPQQPVERKHPSPHIIITILLHFHHFTSSQ
jgi:hypothetical protein